ncbi:paralemmin 1a isoform X3 [Hypomesus transpacificus]|uniref:paralemmin 1a isoform X3 n=1 Tax=Hypomesus transpacificus TaxID=137520 RepID=UPI001F081208|nr:paralemmin 1a isoform X3 [Hypomesus transpacificus]
MPISEDLSHQDRVHAITEKRKILTEIENKMRLLEDDKRNLQYLKSKTLRERWLMDVVQPEQEEVKNMLHLDETRVKELEEGIIRLKQELEELEFGGSATSTQDIMSDETPEEDIKTTFTKAPASSMKAGTGDTGKDMEAAVVTGSSGETATQPNHLTDIKAQNSSCLDKYKGASETMMKAMYSVEITVERDKVTGETRVLSTNTLLPVDLSQGVKVYEDEQKVVHKMNDENKQVHLLSSSEVEELIHKADEVSLISEPAKNTIIPVPKTEDHDCSSEQHTRPKTVITGIEAKSGNTSPQPGTEVNIPAASSDNPVTMVFMGFQNVEDEAETKKFLGLQGTVEAELVVINDDAGKTLAVAPKGSAGQEQSVPSSNCTTPTDTAEATLANGEDGKPQEGTCQSNKEKPCKCCTIM